MGKTIYPLPSFQSELQLLCISENLTLWADAGKSWVVYLGLVLFCRRKKRWFSSKSWAENGQLKISDRPRRKEVIRASQSTSVRIKTAAAAARLLCLPRPTSLKRWNFEFSSVFLNLSSRFWPSVEISKIQASFHEASEIVTEKLWPGLTNARKSFNQWRKFRQRSFSEIWQLRNEFVTWLEPRKRSENGQWFSRLTLRVDKGNQSRQKSWNLIKN